MGSPATSPPLAQDGYQWEGTWVQILPWPTDCITVHIGGLTLVIHVEAVCCRAWSQKQVHLGLVPPEPYCLEKLTGGTILSVLSGLAEPGLFVCYDIQPPGMCWARVTCFLEDQVRIPHSWAQRGPNFIPPLS